MRSVAMLVGLALLVTTLAASIGGCAGRNNVARSSMPYEKLPYRSSTYAAHVDQITRARTGYPW
jgi:hypothetical protein